MSLNALFQIKEFQQIAPYLSLTLIAFLTITSQWLFARLDPEPLRRGQIITFNLLVGSLLVSYYRTCTLDPGRIPKAWDLSRSSEKQSEEQPRTDDNDLDFRRRWCRRSNCVSHRTLPHFIRFLFFSNAAIIQLHCFLWARLHALWQKRLLPSYLGPTLPQLILLFVLTIVATLTLVGLLILFLRTLYSLATNTTTIESWEIDRHSVLLRRARLSGGFLTGPNGTQIRITKQEFPYDIGIWANLVQGMDSSNPIAWFWPFASSAEVTAGTAFEVNGFEDRGTVWPPPDPDRLFRVDRRVEVREEELKSMDLQDFKRRQQEDFQRRMWREQGVVKRRPFHARLEEERSVIEVEESDNEYEDEDDGSEGEHGRPANLVDDADGEEAWRNGEGERLADFGVDEEVEFYDEDDLPLAELMRRRKESQKAAGAS
ncbi:hypothetical protein CAC42_5885 [Sphaceloma murrayae]|uniref:Palmitoyltransferase n=1 Tax=Sphaceloma murrayae TaxID=2082308 RepID=A0A2K1QZF6_9PEZI|nr:hypothetical protein CAC42_5885 [Sphaceloma murrayae]